VILCPFCSNPIEPVGALDADDKEVVAGWCLRCREYVVVEDEAV
jgi:hypothetical protein